MVKEIKCYEDSSGKLHKSAYDAHRADLVLWLLNCSAVNEASALQLANYIADNRKELQAMLDALLAHAPAPDTPAKAA